MQLRWYIFPVPSESPLSPNKVLIVENPDALMSAVENPVAWLPPELPSHVKVRYLPVGLFCAVITNGSPRFLVANSREESDALRKETEDGQQSWISEVLIHASLCELLYIDRNTERVH